MTFEEFARIGTEQQMDAIWEWGFYVGKSSENASNKVLYALNGFFVEVTLEVATNKTLAIDAYHLLSAQLLKRYSLNMSNPFVQATNRTT